MSYLSRMTSSPSIRDILDFWFLPLDDPEHGKPREIWWKSTPEFDAEIGDRFGAPFEPGDRGRARFVAASRPTARWR